MSDALPPPTGPTFDVRLIYGPLLVGIFFNLILYGVTVTQQLNYLQSSRRDAGWLRAFVWTIFIILTANTGFDMWIMYEPLILHYGAMPGKLPTAFVTQPLSVVLVGFPVQVFFIWRIWTLGQVKIIPLIISLFALVSLAGGIWTTVMVPIVAEFRNIPQLYRSAEVWLIASAVTDLAIAVSLAAVLRSKKTGIGATDGIVDKIIRMTVQTGLITALCSVLDVICFLTLQGETVNFIWNIPLPKLYAICLLSTLNARETFRSAFSDARGAISTSAELRPKQNVFSKPQFMDYKGTGSLAEDDRNMGPSELGIRMTKVVERV
ncbi:hypothetical protein MIND_00755400 [Mycena indigotica]|uniref:DUF6534 domain-containing protein n=1 Tax=Mycena indigotica TaxID=2126181 RepID=A0A8H6SM74_9AGAR|nr:uncharacterized protein MIND_00755400 [Mycena indigotica]KAF7301894.1 hypothetical protein MIND_00755400 [Mycena indigotica]